MAAAGDKEPLSLRVTRTFAAPREKVFRAWIEPEAISLWFLPSGGHWNGPPAIEARSGGQYRFTVTHQDKVYSIHGTYREVKPPEKLVFTWQWEDDPNHHDNGDTLVTVELFDRGGKTEVVLTHERFPNPRSRDEHDHGWAGCLDAIAKIVA